MSVKTATPGGTLLNVKVGSVVVTVVGWVVPPPLLFDGVVVPPPQADSPATSANATAAVEMRVDTLLLDMALPSP
jgi:hypothetical protein